MRKGKAGYILGIEGGGTRTVALLASPRGTILARAETGAGNVKHLSDGEMRQRFEELAKRLGAAPRKSFAATNVARAAICLSGCRSERDAARVRRIAAQIWPRAKISATDDLISGLLSGLGKSDGVLIISGTGSCIFAQKRDRTAKVGGWGNFLGDNGSGYRIALLGLRRVIEHFDKTHSLSPLGQKISARLGFNHPEDAVDWINTASKSEVAALAGEVFATKEGQPIVREAARELAAQAALAAQRVGFTRRDRFEVCLSGGVFKNQPRFFELVTQLLRKSFPCARTTLPRGDGALGALQLALKKMPSPAPVGEGQGEGSLAAALTEQRNPRWPNLDRMTVPAIVDAMLTEDATIVNAVRAQRKQITAAIEIIVAAMKRVGKLFYVGAGTSGRLGVLDASECPPTFGVEPDRVQGIIAGGPQALHSSVEAAEDDPAAGAEALRLRGVSRRDVVCGISASGRAPFVLGALDYAQRIGAKTIFLTFNPQSSILNPQSSILICPATGPEFITGSTRLKAGTATKLVLNMLTTISMIRLSKVRGNLMTSVKPTNVKLRDRAVRIVITLAKCNRAEAENRLTRAGWNVERAIARR